MKLAHTRKVHAIMGDRYLRRKNSSIETFEYILFLMQYDAVTKTEWSFIKEKIYIDGHNVRIRYMSDLVRVSPFIFSLPQPSITELIDKHMKTFLSYIKLTDAEIENKVFEIIDKGNLDERYFIFGKYKDKNIRKLARFTMTRIAHPWKTLAMYLTCVMTTVCLSVSLCLVLYLNIIGLSYLIVKPASFLMNVAIADILSFIATLVWLKKWTEPTEFEIQNGYVEE